MFNLFPTINKYRKPVSTTLHTIPHPADMREIAKNAKRNQASKIMRMILTNIKHAADEGENEIIVSSDSASYLTDHHKGAFIAAGYKVTRAYPDAKDNFGLIISWK